MPGYPEAATGVVADMYPGAVIGGTYTRSVPSAVDPLTA